MEDWKDELIALLNEMADKYETINLMALNDIKNHEPITETNHENDD